MRKELEELWQYYLIEVPLQRNDEEKEIIKNYSKCEDILKAKLNEEQKICLKNMIMQFLKQAECLKNMLLSKVSALPFGLYLRLFVMIRHSLPPPRGRWQCVSIDGRGGFKHSAI